MKLNGEIMLKSKPVKLKRSRTLNPEWFPEPDPPYLENTNVEPQKDNVPRHHRIQGPSCKALKCAVSTLSRLDDFILEKLGEGFFAEVFKVTHKTSGEIQVLKMNKIHDNRSNVLRELQLMNRLGHKNILKFMGVCVHEGQLHALTEYINGGDLEQLLANENIELPWTVRMKIVHDIASGINYLHSRGIMHRDLTSKNVLIREETDGSYTGVVGDFGLSAMIPDPQSGKQLSTVGSPFWMAPEVILGQNYNELADTFSYGVICCEITARVSSDPDTLPRTNNFGIDYKAFSELIDYCPLDFLRLAFRCCQVDASKRPVFEQIESNTQQIYENLKNDNLSNNHRERRNSLDGSSYKRSRSEDNILQANGDDDSDSSVTCTPSLIGEAMCRDDPFYEPSISNPFADMAGFRKGGKIFGKSFYDVDPMVESVFELPSPSSPTTPPCTPNPLIASANLKRSSTITVTRKSQSLPSSPVLLRKAAGRLHQESIHGSNVNKKTNNPNRYSFSAYGVRSKSVFFPEAVAQKLQFDMFNTDNFITSSDKTRESSVESDANMNLMGKLPRRHSNVDGLQTISDNSYMDREAVTWKKSSENKLLVDKLLTNQVLDEGNQTSVYPGLNYAADRSEDAGQTNPPPTPTNPQYSKSLPASPRIDNDTSNCDPWTLRREKFKAKSTTIVEESSSVEYLETSV